MDIILFLQYVFSLIVLFVAIFGLSLLKKWLLRFSARLSQMPSTADGYYNGKLSGTAK